MDRYLILLWLLLFEHFHEFLTSLLQNVQAHFVEMDPWVISNVLRPNLEWTGFLDASVIHAVRVEDFFKRSEKFVGVCFLSALCTLTLL